MTLRSHHGLRIRHPRRPGKAISTANEGNEVPIPNRDRSFCSLLCRKIQAPADEGFWNRRERREQRKNFVLMIKELDSVVLTTDLPEHGLARSDAGTVVLVHEGGRGCTVES